MAIMTVIVLLIVLILTFGMLVLTVNMDKIMPTAMATKSNGDITN